MANFQDIVGQEQIVEHLQSAIVAGKISHAYILNGQALSGKKLLAGIFAKALQCELMDKEACDTCQSCLQSDTHNHPDIIWVSHSKPNSIGVEDIREQINNNIMVKPYSSRYKIYIVDDADKMTVQAQNALLKTIEEPPSYGLLLLLTVNASALLPTILSRCVVLNLKPVDNDQIKKYLVENKNVPEEQADFSVSFAMGNIGKAIEVATSEDFNEIKDDCLHLLKYVDEMEVYEMIESIKNLTKYKLNIDDYLDFMIIWYRDVLLLKATSNANILIYKEEYISLNKIVQKSSYEGINNIIKELDKAKIRLKANVNFDLVMELLLLTIKEN